MNQGTDEIYQGMIQQLKLDRDALTVRVAALTQQVDHLNDSLSSQLVRTTQLTTRNEQLLHANEQLTQANEQLTQKYEEATNDIHLLSRKHCKRNDDNDNDETSSNYNNNENNQHVDTLLPTSTLTRNVETEQTTELEKVDDDDNGQKPSASVPPKNRSDEGINK